MSGQLSRASGWSPGITPRLGALADMAGVFSADEVNCDFCVTTNGGESRFRDRSAKLIEVAGYPGHSVCRNKLFNLLVATVDVEQVQLQSKGVSLL